MGKLAHAVLAIRRVNVNDINLPFVLDQKVLQGLVVVADDEFVDGLAVISTKTQCLVFLEITDVVGHALQAFVEMQACTLVGGAQFGYRHGLIVVIGLANHLFQQFGIGGFQNPIGHPFVDFSNQIVLNGVHIPCFRIAVGNSFDDNRPANTENEEA